MAFFPASLSLLILPFAKACDNTELGVGVGSRLAHGIFALDGILGGDEANSIVASLPAKSASDWYPCKHFEESFPEKSCLKLEIDRSPLLRQLRARLAASWNHTSSFDEMTHFPLMVEYPSSSPAMRQPIHMDGFYADGTPHNGTLKKATTVVYLSEPTENHPTEQSGPLLFPDANLSLRPRKGRMLTWTNACSDGSPAPSARHGVGAFNGDDQPPRVAIVFPMLTQAGRSDLVGSGEHIHA